MRSNLDWRRIRDGSEMAAQHPTNATSGSKDCLPSLIISRLLGTYIKAALSVTGPFDPMYTIQAQLEGRALREKDVSYGTVAGPTHSEFDALRIDALFAGQILLLVGGALRAGFLRFARSITTYNDQPSC